MIVCKLWGAPYQDPEADNSNEWLISATVLHEGANPKVDVDYELVFTSMDRAYDFWWDFNSVEGGVRWEDD
jgi:hypothetical protein